MHPDQKHFFVRILVARVRINESKFDSLVLMEFSSGIEQTELMDVETVQKALNRSRASVYRYANTDLKNLNPSYDPMRLNPEYRNSKDDLLMFHPNEVARFARDVLRIKPVTIELKEASKTQTQELLEAILVELQGIHQVLQTRS
jgi:predicted component of type VI protein secretion system